MNKDERKEAKKEEIGRRGKVGKEGTKEGSRKVK